MMKHLGLAVLVWKLACPGTVFYGPYATVGECVGARAWLVTTCPIKYQTFPSVEWRDRYRLSCGSDNGFSCQCVTEND